ncbi:AEC family transporter [Candidatus Sneabacter namystus]|nr:AEC family transporter [Candidatus Sneabacter namystus]
MFLMFFQSVLPIFLIVLSGHLIRRYWISSDEFWRGLQQMSYALFLPAALFSYLSEANFKLKGSMSMVIALILTNVLVCSALIWYQRYSQSIPNRRFPSVLQCSIRYNTYVFLALGKALFGDEANRIASIVIVYMITLVNAISVLAFDTYIGRKKHSSKSRTQAVTAVVIKLLKNPIIFSSSCAILFSYNNVVLPHGLQQFFHVLGQAALGIGSLTIGGELRLKIQRVYIPQICLSTITKLLILPIIAVCMLKLLRVEGMMRSIALLYSCLPCANGVVVLSRQLGGDAELDASIATVQTVLAIFSLAFIMSVFH